MKQKFSYLLAFITLGIANIASAEMLPVPAWSRVLTQDISTDTATSSLLIGRSLFTELLPWVSALIGFIIAGLLLLALRRGVVGGIKRVFGGGRGRGRRR